MFAVTRTLSEAGAVPHDLYPNLVWGVGVHPGDRAALERWDGARFDRLLAMFALVGEVGLDKRAGNLDRQREVFAAVLQHASGAAVLLSIHSALAAGEVVALLEEHRPKAPILHWFGGTSSEVERAVALGAWFSVNGAMKSELLSLLPRDRVLTETDFPYTRRAGSAQPGAVEPVEERLASIWQCDSPSVRRTVWRNLGALVDQGGVRDRLPGQVVAVIEAAAG